jgi:hypothetical protein
MESETTPTTETTTNAAATTTSTEVAPTTDKSSQRVNVRLVQPKKAVSEKFIDLLKCEEQVEALPEPSPSQARVRILTAGVGYTDLLIMSGKYFKSFPFPLVPGEKRCPLALCFRIK